jgi:hypothetical protein
MRPPAFGIAYYCWVSRWKALRAMGIFGAFFIAAFYAFLASAVGVSPVGREMGGAIALLALILWIMLCLVSFLLFEGTDNRFGYPRTFFALPVPTRWLVFWPWFFCTLSLSLPWLAMTALASLLFGTHLPLLIPCLGVAACVACSLAGMWAPIRDPVCKGLAVAAALAVSGGMLMWLFGLAITTFFGPDLPGHSTGAPKYAVAPTLLVCLAAAYLTAHAGVACDRRGDTWLPEVSLAGRKVLDYLRSRPLPRPFGSPARAQCWYLFHSPFGLRGRLSSAALFGLFVFYFCVSRAIRPEVNPHLVVFVFAVGCPVFAVSLAAIAPVILAPAVTQSVLGFQLPNADTLVNRQLTLGFMFARPMSSGGLAAACLRSSLFGVLSSCRFLVPVVLVVGVGWSATLAATGRTAWDWTGVFGDLPAWQWFGLIALAAAAVVVILWRLATDLAILLRADLHQHWTKVAAGFGIVIVSGVALFGVSLLSDPGTRTLAVSVFTWLGLALLVAKVLVAYVAFRAARRAGLLDGTAIRDFRTCWLAVAMPTLLAVAVLLPAQLPVPLGLVVLWIFVLVPLGRLALIAFAFESCRHR